MKHTYRLICIYINTHICMYISPCLPSPQIRQSYVTDSAQGILVEMLCVTSSLRQRSVSVCACINM